MWGIILFVILFFSLEATMRNSQLPNQQNIPLIFAYFKMYQVHCCSY